MVPAELGICALERWITVGLWLLDTVGRIGISDLNHTRINLESIDSLDGRGRFLHTRFGGPSYSTCAETSSWTLCERSIVSDVHP